MTRNTLSIWALTLCCFLPTSSHAEHVAVRVTWSDMHTSDAPGVRAAEPAVVAAAIRPGTPVLRTRAQFEEDLVAVGLDAAGRERYRVVVADPSRVRAEIFEPGTGRFLERRELRRPVDELRLELPMDASVRRLQLYRPDFTSVGTSLALIADLALPAPTAETAPVPSELAADAFLSQIIQNGPGSNRVDLIFVGDGYTAGEVDKFFNDVQNLVSGFLAVEPYATYAGLFNVYGLFVPSNESGADHPERTPPEYRDTALDATYLCDGKLQRLLCADNLKARTILDGFLPLGSRELVVILVNDSEPGGSGIPVVSTDSQSVNIVLHELGHSFGFLDDEYDYDSDKCLRIEPAGLNVTTVTERESIKWSHWIGERTPIPTTIPLTGVPGLYEGARYCPTGMYRPTNDSMMRTLGAPFYAVNEEAIVHRIYEFVRPIDSFSPATDRVTLARGQSMDFAITAPFTVGVTIQVEWYLNGVLKQRGTNYGYTVSAADLRPGRNTLEARVRDTTDKVRFDPMNWLSQTQSWTITLGR